MILYCGSVPSLSMSCGQKQVVGIKAVVREAEVDEEEKEQEEQYALLETTYLSVASIPFLECGRLAVTAVY